MPESDHDTRIAASGPFVAIDATDQREEMIDDEEKVLAGSPDANMPALLTKDVPGG